MHGPITGITNQTGFIAPVMLTAIFTLLAKMQRGLKPRADETKKNMGKPKGKTMNMWENMGKHREKS